MGASHEIKRRARSMIYPIVAALVVYYFVSHAFQGNRSVFVWMHLHKQVTLAEQILSETKSELNQYDRWVSLLRTDQLNRDMLDERARIMAGLVRPDEFIVTDDLAVNSR